VQCRRKTAESEATTLDLKTADFHSGISWKWRRCCSGMLHDDDDA